MAAICRQIPALTVTAVLIALGGLVACADTVDPATLVEADVYATATAANCGCLLYGAQPHRGTPTPTVTGTPPTATRTATPTRPPAGCDFCTMGPQPTHTPRSWPTPLVTCTAAPGQATATVVPTPDSPLFPTPHPPTAQPALLGVGEPAQFGSLEGEAQPGGVATDPRDGATWLIWSQTNPDPGQATAGRVYVRRRDPRSGSWGDIQGIQGPGEYAGTESAIAVATDGTIIAAYIRQQGDTAFVEWRSSRDGGATWSAPADLPDTGVSAVYNLRLAADPAGGVHLAAIAKTGPDGAGGDILSYTYAAGAWQGQRRPVDRGGRQYNLALAAFALDEQTVRTVLLWNEDQHAYTATRDGSGPWSRPTLISGNYPPMDDYQPGGQDHSMQLLAFPWGDTTALWAGYSGYSTGYLACFWSADGGTTWSQESAIGYNPHDDPAAPVQGTVHAPIPYWAAGSSQVAIAYQFCQAGSPQEPRSNCFPALAYAPPGTEGPQWTGAESNTQPPIRLFAPTQAGSAATLRGGGGGAGYGWLLWQEQTGSRELHLAPIDFNSLLQQQEGDTR